MVNFMSLLWPYNRTFDLPQRNSLSRGKQPYTHAIYWADGGLFTSNKTIVCSWKDLLNSTNIHYEEQTELDTSERGPAITGAKVTMAVKQHHSSTLGVDETL